MAGTLADLLFSAVRFVLGGVFLWSGGVKLKDLKGFAAVAVSYSLVPRSLSSLGKAAAYILPFTEIVAGAFLIIREFQTLALYYMAVSLVGYAVLESYELLWGQSMENCGCYGTAVEVELSWWQVAKNLILLMLAVVLLSGSGKII